MPYVTDLQHFLDESGELVSTVPRPARKMALFMTDVVEAVTRAFPRKTTRIETGVSCFVLGCGGEIIGVLAATDAPVEWYCRDCRESGTIEGWQGSHWDFVGSDPVETDQGANGHPAPDTPPETEEDLELRELFEFAEWIARRSPRYEGTVFQLKATLEDIRPQIWRRIQVPGEMLLSELHETLQVSMGWGDRHLYLFNVDGALFGDPDYLEDLDVKYDIGVRVDDVIFGKKDALSYTYDFGDRWKLRLVVEKVLRPEPRTEYPRCMAGRRAGPPEDVGGPWGYRQFLKAIRDPDHAEYDEYRDWLDDDFDPEAFDLEDVNRKLANLV